MTRTTPSSLAVLAAAVAAGAASPATAAARLNHSERAMIRHVNDVRSGRGLVPLRVSHALNRAAESHSRDMLRSDFFDHSSSDGTSFERRVRRYTGAGMIGETLAWTARRHGGAGTIVRMWMNSAPHRAVLLSPGFRRIGIARRWGTLGGSARSVVTADFASGR
jgi:uncharacterized protein YkwD